MKLLHLDASALGSHSVSRGLTAAIVAELTANNPASEVIYHDLVAKPLAHWTPVADASDPVAVQGSQMIDEFLAADVVVIGAPMYNFSIPSQLKAWIDRLAQPGRTFKYTEKGPTGLATGKTVIVVSTRGGIYSTSEAGQAAEHQESYLKVVFGFFGITDVRFLRAEGLAMGPDQKAQALEAAAGDIRRASTEAANQGSAVAVA